MQNNDTNYTFQEQPRQPGIEQLMNPLPMIEDDNYIGSHKLKDKVIIVTGGDSGIGASAAIAFAKEGAHVVIPYYSNYEDTDANRTKTRIEKLGRECHLLVGDLSDEEHCKNVIQYTIDHFGKLDVLVNNHAVQFPQKSLLDITKEQLEKTFQTNIFSFFYLTKAALPHLTKGASIINTTSVVAYEGNELLLDYTATKGAIVSFTRALSKNLVQQGIRVNAVAPGPIWTPLIPASFPGEKVQNHGKGAPMKRAGEPYELAPAYVYLACDDSSYVTGQVLHVNGGTIVGS